ncbi:type II secretion system protein [Filibacter tadaridae]|uniref:Prepilin-type N-terminal cleavage/methylation domain-containing protein n=1 Tax=Filibacter tadaridae TaxID=2483811 RepID=A0A3P5XUA9_9BACL|nr:type II secretion system protein [Filibacter tadaridae]VDC32630.1 hypothetical protein FILTAD_02832 [Filibacter tadaridae]
MDKHLQNESGMSLAELLGAIVILFIITALTFPILLNGIKTANTIQQETMFRDEADYLMVALLKELYVTKESELISRDTHEAGTPNYYIERSTKDGETVNTKTGFINNKLVVANQVINTKNENISILPGSSIVKKEEGQYEVILLLHLTSKKGKTMTFKNFIRTIDDIDKKEVNQ